MDPRTGGSSAPGEPAPLRAVPGVDADALTDTPDGISDVGIREDLREDGALLRDAATLVTAHRRLDGLLLQLAVHPFDPVTHRTLRRYLMGPGVLALAADERVRASTVRGT